MKSKFQSEYCWCFSVDLLMQPKFCCVHLFSRIWRAWITNRITLAYLTEWLLFTPFSNLIIPLPKHCSTTVLDQWSALGLLLNPGDSLCALFVMHWVPYDLMHFTSLVIDKTNKLPIVLCLLTRFLPTPEFCVENYTCFIHKALHQTLPVLINLLLSLRSTQASLF